MRKGVCRNIDGIKWICTNPNLIKWWISSIMKHTVNHNQDLSAWNTEDLTTAFVIRK